MSFQWTFLATFLYFELLVVIILLLPWDKFFKSRLARAFTAGAKYYFNFIIYAIRELRKYSGTEMTDRSTPHAEVHAHMKQFRSQRNFYIAGFALFLCVIKRLIGLLTAVAREMADSAAARKQAEGAHRHLEGLKTNDPSKIDPREIPVSSGNPPRYIDPKVHDAEVDQYKREALKAREDIETLREQYEKTIKEYDELKTDHQKLQFYRERNRTRTNEIVFSSKQTKKIFSSLLIRLTHVHSCGFSFDENS
uniref:Endoplasmic reticulum transmembrane protein n=1 Tax=Philodina roseola TaxID=96448 RepID=B6S367_PHIRO|nr:hypothetical protein [Philodina roseola]